MTDHKTWHVYVAGDLAAEERETRKKDWLSDAPPWRKPRTTRTISRAPPPWDSDERRGESFVDIGENTLDLVNVALLLRRPILVSGLPGIGKSSLAYAIAWRLGLGPPLRWDIGSRTTLKDGLYSYDAVGHLGEIRMAEVQRAPGKPLELPHLGRFITLGPLGTALLPTESPRVLLIDEMDKASYDLPNDLLHVFEEASFSIPELVRIASADVEAHRVYPYDRQSEDDLVDVPRGVIKVHHHPVVVVTTNAERDFAPEFLRRCVQIAWREKDAIKVLEDVVRGWFRQDDKEEVAMDQFEKLRASGGLLNVGRPDLVLQAIGLMVRGVRPDELPTAWLGRSEGG